MSLRMTIAALILLASIAPHATAQERPDWVERIRDDHPRVFLSDDTWPDVRATAEGPMADHYAKVKAQIDGLPAELPVKDYGEVVMNAAFVWKFTGDDAYLQRTREMLDRSLEFYHAQVAADNAVAWYSNSRIMALAAFDWIYDESPVEWRKQWGL